MLIDDLVTQILIALVGGVTAELLHWYGLSRRPTNVMPRYAKKPIYWITTVGMISIGGIMPFLYIQGSASALLCFHLGAATPVILQKLVTSVPDSVVTQGDKPDSIKDFFTW
ncbi:hypothetical protein [Vibrio sp. DNB22_19_1]